MHFISTDVEWYSHSVDEESEAQRGCVIGLKVPQIIRVSIRMEAHVQF